MKKPKQTQAKRAPRIVRVHTLVIGSGAAGLNAAVQLKKNGIDDVLILTEGLQMGTSINTGSDKQTYYKLALSGADADAPRLMAETYFAGGGMHGDLALVEAAGSIRAFMHLVNLGIPFPHDAYGQFVGYKTDHDPLQRATSLGPYTSREMCRALIREVRRLAIPVREGLIVAALLVTGEGSNRRAVGVLAMNAAAGIEAFLAENVVFAVGGPGGLYQTSVYPSAQTGGIGLALEIGARAQSLPELQFGLASTKFRWNVSGSYMQVIPRFISTAADGQSEVREFLRDFFPTPAAMHSAVFLKGYQWPFDARKALSGSSRIDLLVHRETVLRGRRVFLDFRANSERFDVAALSAEARDYLVRSGALGDTPLARLRAMNPKAIELYREHGIDLASDPLEIAVCAQHNNGGLAANLWWESANISHLFPVGEVNGSHGVCRPGGSALNSGQVGGFRLAEYIAARYRERTLDEADAQRVLIDRTRELLRWRDLCQAANAGSWRDERHEFQARMSRAGAHIRSADSIKTAVKEARRQYDRFMRKGCRAETPDDLREATRNRSLCLAHCVYLEAIEFAITNGVGSRGSSLVLNKAPSMSKDLIKGGWTARPENLAFREQVQETERTPNGTSVHRWIPRRPIPETNGWYETTWAAFCNGTIYNPPV